MGTWAFPIWPSRIFPFFKKKFGSPRQTSAKLFLRLLGFTQAAPGKDYGVMGGGEAN